MKKAPAFIEFRALGQCRLGQALLLILCYLCRAAWWGQTLLLTPSYLCRAAWWGQALLLTLFYLCKAALWGQALLLTPSYLCRAAWWGQALLLFKHTGGVFECDIAHRRSVAVFCMLYKIRFNPMHPLNDALPEPYVPVRVTRGALVAHRYTYAPPRCRTSQYRRTFVPISVFLWNDFADPVFDGVGLAGFKSRANAFLLATAALSLL